MKHRLGSCPQSSNCVSSLSADKKSAIEPVFFSTSPTEVQEGARRIIETLPGVRITRDEPGYLHAELTSRLFRFVDDLEIFIDAEGRRIDYRSASRIGYYDFGVNRRRLEALRRLLLKNPGISSP